MLLNKIGAIWHQWKKKSVYERYIQRSHHYKALKTQGKTEDEILKILNEKKEIQLFDWDGQRCANHERD